MFTVVLLSGGSGKRMKNTIPKQYMQLAGKPVIMHILERVDNLKSVLRIVIVCTETYQLSIKLMLEQYGITKEVVFAPAGQTRQESVLNGLEYVKTDQVIIHEAARPFVTVDDFIRLIECESENAIYGLPIAFTVLKGHDIIEGELNRSELINVQLPQKFRTNLLLESHRYAKEDSRIFTEDSSMVYHYFPDERIVICPGMEYNIKLTTRQDMITGEIIYQEVFCKRK